VPPNNDPYFRPTAIYSNTRGELTQIIALGADWQDPIPSSQQTYEDVPPGNPYWLAVERATLHGVIGGYVCGEPGEPCVPPGNRNYFRLNRDVVRGEFARYITNAAGFSETPTGQTFEDVGPTRPFYIWIERAALHGVLAGFPCGGAAEPCVPPDNRPYFRLYDPLALTRAEMAQALARAFLPACPVLSPTPTATGTPPTPTYTRTAYVTPSRTPTATRPTATPTRTPTLEPTTSCPAAWSIVPDPDPGHLAKVAVSGPQDAWAVGDAALHWDGVAWTAVPVPGQPQLNAVAVDNPSDAWAVSDQEIYHWNGSQWTTAPSPTPEFGPCYHSYTGVAAYGANDVWIVGDNDACDEIVHYSGGSWAAVGPAPGAAVPSGAVDLGLEDVWADGPGTAWAVGWAICGGCHGTRIMRLTPSGWSPVVAPDYGPLYAVVSVSATDAWAGGSRGSCCTGTAASGPQLLPPWSGRSGT
jgi:hypothetical protein